MEEADGGTRRNAVKNDVVLFDASKNRSRAPSLMVRSRKPKRNIYYGMPYTEISPSIIINKEQPENERQRARDSERDEDV